MVRKLITGITVGVLGLVLCLAGPVVLGGVGLAGCPPTPPASATPTVAWDDEQVANATTIVRVGAAMHIPARGWVIAVATAMQESGLRNLDHGDRDSVGLFQQRPSQGWGTPDQLRDPAYAAGAFSTALREVDGWQQLPLTVAAQTVQHSAYPDAYAKWEPDAAALVATIAADQALSAPPGTGPCGNWVRPVDGPVVSEFRSPSRPGHDGIDIAAPHGTPVRAAAAGTVTTATCNAYTAAGDPYPCDRDGSPAVRGCGWYLEIAHPDRSLTRYCHLQTRPLVNVGAPVTAGQVVGHVGSSGHSSGPHLHLETHLADPPNTAGPATAVDPRVFFAVRGVTF